MMEDSESPTNNYAFEFGQRYTRRICHSTLPAEDRILKSEYRVESTVINQAEYAEFTKGGTNMPIGKDMTEEELLNVVKASTIISADAADKLGKAMDRLIKLQIIKPENKK